MFFAMTQALYCFGLTLPADLRKKYMQIKAQHTKHLLLMPQQRSVHLLFFCALQIPSVLHVCESVFPSVSDAPADAQAVPAGSDPDTVSYTHLDVYKRQAGMIFFVTISIIVPASIFKVLLYVS